MYDGTFRQQVSTSVGCSVILLSTSAISEIQADVLICYNAGSCVALEKMVKGRSCACQWSLKFKCQRNKLCMSIKAEIQVWNCFINIYMLRLLWCIWNQWLLMCHLIWYIFTLNWSILMLCELNWYEYMLILRVIRIIWIYYAFSHICNKMATKINYTLDHHEFMCQRMN